MKIKNNQKTWYFSLLSIFVILFIMRVSDLFLVGETSTAPPEIGSLIMGILVIVCLGVTYCLNSLGLAKTLGVLYLLFFFFEIGRGYSLLFQSDLLMVVQLLLAIIGFVLTVIYLKAIQKADKRKAGA